MKIATTKKFLGRLMLKSYSVIVRSFLHITIETLILSFVLYLRSNTVRENSEGSCETAHMCSLA